ncbi:hypothetical protein HPB48_014103 [Haemaphysalis longicornis]|uniref:Uncharacterized protein n=1 Tax=Haemaphysalis longicornis TaxID=44386 RepID=A0A9J6FJI8_HAELO|nr:hypothetical protein HPB48_014103 [Haemaphysalis longicornis]
MHHFISKQQEKYLRELKSNLKDKETILLLDFAENFSSRVQDASQSYNWVNTHSTIHPIVGYHHSEETGDLSVKSFAVISDCLDDTTAAVDTVKLNTNSLL